MTNTVSTKTVFEKVFRDISHITNQWLGLPTGEAQFRRQTTPAEQSTHSERQPTQLPLAITMEDFVGLDLVSTTGQARPPSSAGAPESFNVGVGPDVGVLEEDQVVSDRSASQSGPGQTHAGGCAIRLLREAGVAPPGPAPPRGAPCLRAVGPSAVPLARMALPRLSVAPVSLSTARRSGVVAPASWAWAAAEGLAGALVMLEDEITLVVAGGGISRSLVERHGVVLLHCGRPATVVLFSATEGEPAKKKIRGNDDQTRPETPASLGRQHGRPPADASRKRGGLQDYVAKNPRVPRWSACFQLRGMGGDLRLEAWKAKRRLQAGKYGVRPRAGMRDVCNAALRGPT